MNRLWRLVGDLIHLSKCEALYNVGRPLELTLISATNPNGLTWNCGGTIRLLGPHKFTSPRSTIAKCWSFFSSRNLKNSPFKLKKDSACLDIYFVETFELLLLTEAKRAELIPQVLDALLDFHLNLLRRLQNKRNEAAVVDSISQIVYSEACNSLRGALSLNITYLVVMQAFALFTIITMLLLTVGSLFVAVEVVSAQKALRWRNLTLR
uniref:Uncharacterized protein n=1 Tax=Parascaris equorum TaxID=6256 RepID=A0A914RFP8_PAREQ